MERMQHIKSTIDSFVLASRELLLTDRFINDSLRRLITGSNPNGYKYFQITLDSIYCHHNSNSAKNYVLNHENGQGTTLVHLAVTFSNKNCLRVLLSHGADVNALDKRGPYTPLDLVEKDHDDAGIGPLLIEYNAKRGPTHSETTQPSKPVTIVASNSSTL